MKFNVDRRKRNAEKKVRKMFSENFNEINYDGQSNIRTGLAQLVDGRTGVIFKENVIGVHDKICGSWQIPSIFGNNKYLVYLAEDNGDKQLYLSTSGETKPVTLDELDNVKSTEDSNLYGFSPIPGILIGAPPAMILATVNETAPKELGVIGVAAIVAGMVASFFVYTHYSFDYSTRYKHIKDTLENELK